MTYPDLRTALAAERIADLRREATRRRTVLAALRGRRRRHTVACDLRSAVQAPALNQTLLENRRDRQSLAIDRTPIARP